MEYIPSRTHVPFLVSQGRVECKAEVVIGAAVQTVGTGLADLTPAGTYLGPGTTVYTFKISTAAGTDKFQWKKGAGAYSAEIDMTGAAQAIETGLTVLWAATTGHTLNDEFTVTVTVNSALIAYDKAGNVLLEIKNDGTVTLPGLLDALVYKGVLDCSGNPNYPAADAGHIYIVSVAGKAGGASGDTVEVGDMLLCKTDGSAAGTKAAVGANWNILQTSLNPTDFVTHALATAANDSLWASGAGAGAFVKKTLAEVKTLLNIPRVVTLPSDDATITVGETATYNTDTADMFVCLALAQATNFGAPGGAPTDGQKIMFRILDNGTARALTWDAVFDEGDDLALPTTTVLGKAMYCSFVYNSVASKWQLVGQVGGF